MKARYFIIPKIKVLIVHITTSDRLMTKLYISYLFLPVSFLTAIALSVSVTV